MTSEDEKEEESLTFEPVPGKLSIELVKQLNSERGLRCLQ